MKNTYIIYTSRRFETGECYELFHKKTLKLHLQIIKQNGTIRSQNQMQMKKSCISGFCRRVTKCLDSKKRFQIKVFPVSETYGEFKVGS